MDIWTYIAKNSKAPWKLHILNSTHFMLGYTYV